MDHGSLTGLTSAMYLTPRGEQLPPADTTVGQGGLYVRTRRGSVVRVTIPADCVAFQLGECAQVRAILRHSSKRGVQGLGRRYKPCAGRRYKRNPTATQVASGGLLRATPHCVRAAADASLARNTFVCFMQPRW